MRHDHALRGLLSECRRLLSERGEANGPAIASTIVERIDALADERRARFFDHLARDFSPDPKAVLASAQAYALKPGAEQLMRLTQVTEPPRQPKPMLPASVRGTFADRFDPQLSVIMGASIIAHLDRKSVV